MALSEEMFFAKMEKLSNTQQAIENTSSWCCLWRGDARKIVEWWEKAFTRADQSKRLYMIYLANDVIQNSRRKGPEFVTEFYKVLPRALRYFLVKADDSARTSVNKVIKVWEDRRVFGSTGTKTLHQIIEEAEVPSLTPRAASQSEEAPSHHLPSPVDVAALADAVRSAELACSQAALLAPQALSQSAGHSAAHHATVDILESYRAALAREVKLREEACLGLEAAASAQKAAHAHAINALKACEAVLNATRAAEKVSAATDTSLPDQNEEAAAVEIERNEPPSVEAQPVSAPAGDDAPNQAHISEAASLAAKLMSNPQALLDAIAATVPRQTGPSAGGQDHSEEEYDPENPF